MQQEPKSGHVFSRIIVPLLLFLVVVGAIGFLVQNIQMWVPRQPGTDEVAQKTLLYFQSPRAYWGDEADPEYVKEFEFGQEGSYDFPFENNTKTELEMGLDRTSCTCNKVKVALISGASDQEPKWIELKKADGKAEQEVVPIPVGGKGKVRLVWGKEADKDKVAYGTSSQSFSAQLWIQPRGLPQSRKTQDLFVQVKMVPKVEFNVRGTLDLGMIATRQTSELICWSATRNINDPKNPLTIDANYADRGFKFKITPLTDSELAAFQKELNEAKPPSHSRAKSAARISVEVSPDQLPFDGPFTSIRIPLFIDGVDYSSQAPFVSGGVEPSVALAGCPQGKITLQQSQEFTVFSATPEQKVLTIVRTPLVISVSLETSSDEGRPRWKLKVVRPANTRLSQDDNTIVIRSQPRENCVDDAMSYAAVLGKLGGPAPAGCLPDAGNICSLRWSFKLAPFGEGARQTRIPVLTP